MGPQEGRPHAASDRAAPAAGAGAQAGPGHPGHPLRNALQCLVREVRPLDWDRCALQRGKEADRQLPHHKDMELHHAGSLLPEPHRDPHGPQKHTLQHRGRRSPEGGNLDGCGRRDHGAAGQQGPPRHGGPLRAHGARRGGPPPGAPPPPPPPGASRRRRRQVWRRLLRQQDTAEGHAGQANGGARHACAAQGAGAARGRAPGAAVRWRRTSRGSDNLRRRPGVRPGPPRQQRQHTHCQHLLCAPRPGRLPHCQQQATGRCTAGWAASISGQQAGQDGRWCGGQDHNEDNRQPEANGRCGTAQTPARIQCKTVAEQPHIMKPV